MGSTNSESIQRVTLPVGTWSFRPTGPGLANKSDIVLTAAQPSCSLVWEAPAPEPTPSPTGPRTARPSPEPTVVTSPSASPSPDADARRLVQRDHLRVMMSPQPRIHVPDRSDDRGLSLVELMVAMAVFSVLMVMVSALSIQGYSAVRNATSLTEVQAEQQNAMLWMSRLLRYTDNPYEAGTPADGDHVGDRRRGRRLA